MGNTAGPTITHTYMLGTDEAGNLMTGQTASMPALVPVASSAASSPSGTGYACVNNSSDSRIQPGQTFSAGGAGSNGVHSKYVMSPYVMNRARTITSNGSSYQTWQIEVCGDGDINPTGTGFSVYLGGVSLAETHNQANGIIGRAGTTGPDPNGTTMTSTYGFQSDANQGGVGAAITGNVSYTSKANAYVVYGPNGYLSPVHVDAYNNTEMSSFWGWDGCCESPNPVGTVGQALWEYPESDNQTKTIEADVYYTTCNGGYLYCND